VESQKVENMRYLVGFAFLLPTIALAKEPRIPESLLNAKTAFVSNDGASDKDIAYYRKFP
jgi:hypothetical protein